MSWFGKKSPSAPNKKLRRETAVVSMSNVSPQYVQPINAPKYVVTKKTVTITKRPFLVGLARLGLFLLALLTIGLCIAAVYFTLNPDALAHFLAPMGL